MKSECSICSSKEITSKIYLSRHNHSLKLYQCKNCGHLSQGLETFDDIYTSGEYSKTSRSNAYLPSNSKIEELDRKAFERFEFYKEFIHSNNNFLEIGSAMGSIVHLLKLAGKKAAGLEPDPNYAQFSEKQYGFSQFSSTLENLTTEEKFDAAYSFHVIEHVEKPNVFVQKLSSLLNTGAKIMFECPSLEIHSFGDMKNTIWKPHVHYFSASSIYLLFSQYFQIETISYRGADLFIKAQKSEKSTFNKSDFDKYKRQSERIFAANSKMPVITAKFPVKQLFIQSAIQKGKLSYLFSKAINYSLYKIDEASYVRNEKKAKGIDAFHVSALTSWGSSASGLIHAKCTRDIFRQKKAIQFNLKSISENLKKGSVDEINKNKFLLIGSGGLFLPDTNENANSGWQWAIQPNDLTKIKIPIIVYSIGYNYFRGQKNTPLFLENLKLLIKKSSFFSLQNMGSLNKINELTQNEFKEKLIYQPSPTSLINKFTKTTVKQKTKNIAINVAFDRTLLRYGKDMEPTLASIAKALKKLEQKGYKIVNLTHIKSDKRFEILLERFNVNYKTIELQYLFPKEIYKLYNSMELVIGMREQAQMIPFGLNTKILTLGTHDKMRWFLEDIDALDWYVELNNQKENIEKLILDKAEDILEKNASFVEKKLIEKQNMLFEIVQRNLKKIYKII